jgi:hypothetical protein
VINSYGGMIALHDDSIHFTLYPLAMISKRLEGRRGIDLPALDEDLATLATLGSPPAARGKHVKSANGGRIV